MGDLSADKLALFALFALPGAVAIRVYTLWCPTPEKDWKDSVFDALLYSSVSLAVWQLLVPSTVRGFVTGVLPATPQDPAITPKSVLVVLDHGRELILYSLATPAALTWVWYTLRTRLLHRHLGFDHPIRTAWDWVFSRKKALYVYFILKSKDKDGQPNRRLGYFNGVSYVTTYPHEPEIYVERVHQMGPHGQPGMPIPGSAGMLVKLSECERLEFLYDPMPAPPTLIGKVCGLMERSPGIIREWCDRAGASARASAIPLVNEGVTWLVERVREEVRGVKGRRRTTVAPAPSPSSSATASPGGRPPGPGGP